MGRVLTNLGEEYVIKNGLVGAAFVVGLYNDATDTIGEGDDLLAITSEPNGAAYTHQTVTFEGVKGASDWQGQANARISFNTSDSNGTVDSYYIAKIFQAEESGDVSPTLHLLCTGALSQNRDLFQIDTLYLPKGSVGIKLS